MRAVCGFCTCSYGHSVYPVFPGEGRRGQDRQQGNGEINGDMNGDMNGDKNKDTEHRHKTALGYGKKGLHSSGSPPEMRIKLSGSHIILNDREVRWREF
jgi:hypothetical protein